MSLKGIKNASTLAELKLACRSAKTDMKQDVNELSKKVALLLSRRLIYETPVDTSQALSNWRVGLSYRVKGVIPAHVLGKKASTDDQSTALAIMAAYGEIQQKKYGQVVHLTNNLKYIVDLNNGKSGQAAAHFIDVIEAQVQLEADKLLRDYVNGN